MTDKVQDGKPQTPAEVLSAAAKVLRADCPPHYRLTARLLDDIACDMEDEDTTEQQRGAEVMVGYRTAHGDFVTVFPWTSAVALARDILAGGTR